MTTIKELTTDLTANSHQAEALKKIQALTKLQDLYRVEVERVDENKRIVADAIAAEQDALNATNIELEEQIKRIIKTDARRKALERRAAVKDPGVNDALKQLAEEVMVAESWLTGVTNFEARQAEERIKSSIAESLRINPGKLSSGDLSLVGKSPVVLKWRALTPISHLSQNHEIIAGRFPEGAVVAHVGRTLKWLNQLLELAKTEDTGAL
jgi:hypothetical protein